MDGKMFCIYCLSGRVMELRYDKRSRPYLMCAGCGTRTFTRLGMFSISSYAAIASVCETNAAALREKIFADMKRQGEAVKEAVSAGVASIQEAFHKEILK